MDFYSSFQKFLFQEYPSTRPFQGEAWRHIVFPEIVSAPPQALKAIQTTAALIHSLKRDPKYAANLQKKAPVDLLHPQDSVLTVFDFHLDFQGLPRLIEVNTNGSGFLIGNALCQYHGLPYKTALQDLRSAFQQEWEKFQEWGGKKRKKTAPIHHAPAPGRPLAHYDQNLKKQTALHPHIKHLHSPQKSVQAEAGGAAGRRGAERIEAAPAAETRGAPPRGGEPRSTEPRSAEAPSAKAQSVEDAANALHSSKDPSVQSGGENESASGGQKNAPLRIALIDERLQSQKMLLEFLMFKDFFSSLGWKASLSDISLLKLQEGSLQDSEGAIDFCYNRSTDFYFQNNPHLLQAFQEKICAFSPHPAEHFLLSHKDRLCEWHDLPILQPVRHVLLKTQRLASSNKESAWKNKKKLFFKPAGKYGGKGVYRGKGITVKTFQRLCEAESVFQTYSPPPLWKDKSGAAWKLDLRAFVYGPRVQQILARLYQGQVTNFQHFGGGFAPVVFAAGKESENLILPPPGAF